MAAHVSRWALTPETSFHKPRSWTSKSSIPGLEQSPHTELCDVLVQLRRLSLDTSQNGFMPAASIWPIEDYEVSSASYDHDGDTGLAVIQYESHTAAPPELLQMHKRKVKPILDALLLRHDNQSSKANETEIVTEKEIQLDFLKVVAYGATNNFAGMDDPAWREVIFRSLNTILSPIMQIQARDSSLWRNVSQLQSLKPMTETYFRCAVERGDHNAVAQLLSWPEVNIDVNNIVCTVDSNSLTPLEVAASLHNLDLVRILLQYGANANKVLEPTSSLVRCKCSLREGGAVYHACVSSRSRPEPLLKKVNVQLVSLLVNAGGMICSTTLRYVASFGGATLVPLFLNAPMPQDCRSLMAAGVMHEAVYQLDVSTQQRLLVSMHDAKAGLQDEFKYYPPVETQDRDPPWSRHLDEEVPYPAHLIDIAAQRGQLGTVKLLRLWRYSFTKSTLVAGIRSLDAALVQFLLDEGAPRICFSTDYLTTPLAEAILLKNAEVSSQLGDLPEYANQRDPEAAICALLAAAAEVGDEELLDQLLANMCDKVRRESILGYALTRACKNNHLGVARKLLESSASTARGHYTAVMGFEAPPSRDLERPCPCPLVSAAINKNEEILTLLLDHDVGDSDHMVVPIGSVTPWWTPFIEWGSLLVVELLESVGIVLNTEACLIKAVQTCNGPLAAFLLARSPLDYRARRPTIRGPWDYNGYGALETAVRSNEETMLRLLLESKNAIHPISEPEAFAAALQYAPHLYQVLLEKLFAPGMTPAERNDRHGRRLFDVVWYGAIRYHRPDIVYWLASNFQDIESSHLFGQLEPSPLRAAIEQEEYSVLDFLISSLGVSPDTTVPEYDWDDQIYRLTRLGDGSRLPCLTALTMAISFKKIGMINALLKHGADVDLPAKYNIKRTPLQQAAETGDLTIIELLITAGADIKAPPAIRNGGTPIQLAAIQGFIGVVQCLERHGDDLWASGSIVGGRTALEGAAEHGRFDMVHYLASCKPPDLDQYGTARKFALKNGHGAIADMLETMFHARMAEAKPVTTQLPGVSSAIRRRHVCSTCRASFTKASALRRHERSHQDTYAYRCSECDQGFRRKDTLDRHVETQHTGACHQCHVCGDEFSRRDTLSQHMRSKHREAAQVAAASTTSSTALWA